MKHALRLLPFLLCVQAATAHEGHGMPGAAHYHATDAWGWVIAALLIGAACWFIGRGK